MKRLALLGLLLLAAQPAFAATGIFQTYVVLDRGAGNVFFEGSGPDNNSTNPLFESTYFAPTTSGGTFVLKGAEINTFKNGTPDISGTDVTGTQLFYRVTLLGAAPGTFTQLNIPFNTNLPIPGDQRWQETAASVDLAALCGVGNVCQLDFYFRATTNNVERLDNNGGSNYHVDLPVQ